MFTRRLTHMLGLLLMAGAPSGYAQSSAVAPDSVRPQILSVLRAYYLNLANQNWDGLAAYVLSPKLLERRGGADDHQMFVQDRIRGRGSPAAVAAPGACPSSASPMISEADIRLDGDWAEVSVPRCSGPIPGVDEFGILYFEKRWRFIYTDLFEGRSAPQAAQR
jgi:hypothetical protein